MKKIEKIKWDQLNENEYRELYRRWMNDPSNAMRCDECPYGKGGFHNLPCGQQNCWVDATCKNLGGC